MTPKTAEEKLATALRIIAEFEAIDFSDLWVMSDDHSLVLCGGGDDVSEVDSTLITDLVHAGVITPAVWYPCTGNHAAKWYWPGHGMSLDCPYCLAGLEKGGERE